MYLDCLFDFEGAISIYNRLMDCVNVLEDLEERDLLDMDKVWLLL